MPRPPVIAHHLIWTAYGCWLPNDPRGSGSESVADPRIAELGELHYGRREIQPAGAVVREFYDRADDTLKFPRLTFSEVEFTSVADAIGQVVDQRNYTCYACAVMPDHVHLVIRKHRDKAEEMIRAIQAESRDLVVAAGLRDRDHPVWTLGGWKVFLDHPDHIRRTIVYVERNPTKADYSPQAWAFVTDYDGWPLHPGHNPNSVLAKRLRASERFH